MKNFYLIVVYATTTICAKQITSNYKRPRASKELLSESVDCNFTFSTYQKPNDDYFRGSACASQVHLTQNSPHSVTISFVSTSAETPSRIEYGLDLNRMQQIAYGNARAYTALMSVDSNLYEPNMGAAFASKEEVHDVTNTTAWAVKGSASRSTGEDQMTGLLSYNNPGAIYSSPLLHTVNINNLQAGQTYYYSIPHHVSRNIFHFRLAKKKQFPFILGLMADIGQTIVSNASIWNLGQMKPDAILLAGDLSYSDGWPFRWDTFARLIEPLASIYPILHVGGNHELGSSENWIHYLERWPTPNIGQAPSPLFWSVDIGPLHLIGLNSYDNFVQGGDRIQRAWLLSDLAHYTTYQRSHSQPWLAVLFHVPFYSSNGAHHLEGELMRKAYEPILYAAGVDFIITGHVHAYERTNHVYNNNNDICGPIYFGLGDAGNRESTYTDWFQPQPEWSIFRESSFGVGQIIIHNSSSLRYEWHREACATNNTKNNYQQPTNGINLNALDCHTPKDNGGFAYEPIDFLDLTKSSDPSCTSKRAHIAASIGLNPLAFHLPPTPHSEEANNNLIFPRPKHSSSSSQKKENDQQRSHIPLIIALLFLLMLLFAFGIFLAARRFVILSRSPSRIFYTVDSYSSLSLSDQIIKGYTRSVPNLTSYSSITGTSTTQQEKEKWCDSQPAATPLQGIQLT